MGSMFWLLLCFSILSLLYFCIISVYSGIDTSFSWFWPAAGTVGIMVCFLIRNRISYGIEVRGGIFFLLSMIVTICLAVFLYIETVLIYNSRQKLVPGLDYVIILGAQVKGMKLSRTLLKRLDYAVWYMKENRETIAIVSGGKGRSTMLTEAEAMKQYLVRKGISKDRIKKEEKARNTFENFLYSKSFLNLNSSVACITNGFHIYRSLQIARKQGLNQIRGLSAPTDKVLAVNYYVREAVGVIKDKVLGNL